eukprot:COSAG04_NODE_15166_length_541_cov_1.233032_1_plen_30_part_10
MQPRWQRYRGGSQDFVWLRVELRIVAGHHL